MSPDPAMTTASQHTDDKRIEFTTASEFLLGDEPDADDLLDREGPPFAKGKVWYDRSTVIFACLDCYEHVRALRFEGPDMDPGGFRDRRSEANRRLVEDDPRCDVCAGRLPSLLGADR